MKRIKDQKYYMENVDIEAEIMIKATQIAEKMVAAMMREQSRSKAVDIDIDYEHLADLISEKLNITGGVRLVGDHGGQVTDAFSFDDEPSIVKTGNFEVAGELVKKTKTKESTDDALDALMNLEI